MTAANVPIYRPTARVLLVDESRRLLMFSSDEGSRTFWYPPGGGVEPGETFEVAARREVFEETGLALGDLGAEIWHQREQLEWGGQLYDLDERYFLCRVDAFVPDTRGFTPAERYSIVAFRWWSFEEVDATNDRLVPEVLPDLLRSLS